MRLLARTEGIFGETAGGVTGANLRRQLREGLLDPDAETVIYNTGDGLKTLDPLVGNTVPTADVTDVHTYRRPNRLCLLESPATVGNSTNTRHETAGQVTCAGQRSLGCPTRSDQWNATGRPNRFPAPGWEYSVAQGTAIRGGGVPRPHR
jgi:hypothetical protein